MKTVKFDCPDCGQRIEAPDEILDSEVTCPTCNAKWTVVIEDVMDVESAELLERVVDAHRKRFGSSRNLIHDFAVTFCLKPRTIEGWLKDSRGIGA